MAKEDLRSQSDSALVTQLGDEPDALACLYDRYGSLVYAIALRVLKETTAAEDVVNDVFLQLWKKPESFEEARGKLPSWLTVITRNKAVDILRKRRSETEITEIEDNGTAQLRTESPQYFSADFEKAQRLMNALPVEQKKALELAYLDGLTQSEISARLGEPLGTVKSRIRLGLNTLKKALA